MPHDLARVRSTPREPALHTDHRICARGTRWLASRGRPVRIAQSAATRAFSGVIRCVSSSDVRQCLASGQRHNRQRVGDSTTPADRLRAERPDHLWALDYQFDVIATGHTIKVLHVVDEVTRESLADPDAAEPRVGGWLGRASRDCVLGRWRRPRPGRGRRGRQRGLPRRPAARTGTATGNPFRRGGVGGGKEPTDSAQICACDAAAARRSSA